MKPSDKEILYPYVLEDKPRFLLGWVLYALFRRAKVDENAMEGLKQLQQEGTVVYATKYRGHLDYLLYHFNLMRRRLPYPESPLISTCLCFTRQSLFQGPLLSLSYFYRSGKFPSLTKRAFTAKPYRQARPPSSLSSTLNALSAVYSR